MKCVCAPLLVSWCSFVLSFYLRGLHAVFLMTSQRRSFRYNSSDRKRYRNSFLIIRIVIDRDIEILRYCTPPPLVKEIPQRYNAPPPLTQALPPLNPLTLEQLQVHLDNGPPDPRGPPYTGRWGSVTGRYCTFLSRSRCHHI